MTATVALRVRSVRRRVWPALLHRVVRTVRSRGLFDRGQHVLIAVSGGPDSIALLSLLHRLRLSWRLTLTVVHFNYGLRGDESEADQAFVEAMCRRLELPFQTMRLDVRRRVRGVSLQAAARELRYRAMHDIARRCGADRIAVGHTANDQAETVLLWMLRGSGLTGLAGMSASRDGIVVRPLYEVTRDEILAYLSNEGVLFRQDSSNDKPIYLRNRIRQEVIPVLQRLVPSAVEALCRLADLCRDDDRYLGEHVQALCHPWISQRQEGGWEISRQFLRKAPVAVQRRLVRELLMRGESLRRSPRRDTVERVLRAVLKQGVSSHVALSSSNVVVEKDSVRFAYANRPEQSHGCQTSPTIVTVPGSMTWAGTGQQIQVQEVTRQQVGEMVPTKDLILIDADRISEPLMVRAWQPGDRFYPFGMKGRSKKLQDFFTDMKLSRADRRRIPLVVAQEGIVWVVGYRQDQRWSVMPDTKRYVALTVHPSPTEE